MAVIVVTACDLGSPAEPHPSTFPPRASLVAVGNDLERLASGMAAALGEDEALRTTLMAAMAASTHAEGKLDFNALVTGRGAVLRDALAAGAKLTTADLEDLVGSLGLLELYLPVDDHRASWQGGDDLLVMAAFDEAATYIAYDLDGNRIILPSDAPPAQPVLVVTRRESDLGRQVATLDLRGEPERFTDRANLSSSGLIMSKSYIPDDHEGWPFGDPEIVIHTAVGEIIAGTTQVDWFQCSGDLLANPDFNFDQNNSFWTGEVLILHDQQLPDSGLVTVQVWEDDYAQCNGSTNVLPHASPWSTPDWAGGIVLGTIGAAGLYCTINPGPNPPQDAFYACPITAGALLYTWQQFAAGYIHDDFIGQISGVPGNCYSGSTVPTRFWLKDQSGSPTGGYIELEDDFIDYLELCAVGVSIQGDTFACAWGDPSGSFSASVTTPDTGVTYQWREDGVIRGSASTYDLYNHSIGTRLIEVTVNRLSDGSSASSQAYIDVIDPEGPQGWQCLT